MKKSIVGKLLCLIGIHDWEFSCHILEYGAAIGDKCNRCGKWEDDPTHSKVDWERVL